MCKRMTILGAMVLLAVALGGPGNARALQVTAGYTRSDVGLHEDGDGFTLAVGGNVLRRTGPVDLTVAVEYVQRAGTQPRYFSHPVEGLVLGDAEVKLHYLQPAVFAGVTMPLGGLAPRFYGGFSLALKVGEDWTQPAGETNGDLGYEDTDFLGHVGLSLGVNRFCLDFRYSFGFNSQLIDGTHPVAKAAGDDGVDDVEDGAKISGFQVGLGMGF